MTNWSVCNSVANTSKGVLFLPPSDAYVRSFLYLLYTLIKLYYTKALSDQGSSLALDWILLLWRPRNLGVFLWFSNNFSWAHLPQLLLATAHMPRACAPQQREPPQWEACALQPESGPSSPQLEKSLYSNEDSAQPNERLLLNHANTPGFLAPGGEEFNPGPETRLDRSELLCNKVLLKHKGDRESFWHRHQKRAERVPPC